jgi:hypothetical protein
VSTNVVHVGTASEIAAHDAINEEATEYTVHTFMREQLTHEDSEASAGRQCSVGGKRGSHRLQECEARRPKGNDRTRDGLQRRNHKFRRNLWCNASVHSDTRKIE